MPTQQTNQSRSLNDWLCYLQTQHHSAIDLGLERIDRVARMMQLTQLSSRVITVAGTNGKGSTCRLVEQLLLAQGYSVGVYSSPHLIDYRERVRLNDAMLSSPEHCGAFAAVEEGRKEISLSYFEFGTLAALWLFQRHCPDFVILEVGLGGRLDATNVVEPDVAVVTTVALDHVDWLGDDIAQIGREKAGIFRENGKAVVGDPAIVESVLEQARKLNCHLLANGQQIAVKSDGVNDWSYRSSSREYKALPVTSLPRDNAVAAIACIEQLGVEMTREQLVLGLNSWHLPGRLQYVSENPRVLVDVAHNPQSAMFLAEHLKEHHNQGRVLAVCAMLSDKDERGTVSQLFPYIDHWFISGLDDPRGDNGQQLEQALFDQAVSRHGSLLKAYKQAFTAAEPVDLIVVFGSFLTVAMVLKECQ